MPQIIVVTRDGAEQSIDGRTGVSVMVNLRNGGIDDIAAICGGCCSCATCHVYIDPDWFDRLPAEGEDEIDLLEMSRLQLPNSRLSCQISFTDELAGLRLTVAPEE